MKKTGTFKVSAKPRAVSWIFDSPAASRGLVVLSHGAGANMSHSAMNDYAKLLQSLSFSVFRFNFPYLENGSGGPNRPPILIETIRTAIDEAQAVYTKVHSAGVSLMYFAGKSMGGRMGSLAEAESALGINGLIFFGFPLHAPGKPSTDRADHLAAINVPMLFLQGQKDKLSTAALIQTITEKLPRATLHFVKDADHSFKVPKRTGKTNEDIMIELTDAIAAFVHTTID